jgi:hypothetical protein
MNGDYPPGTNENDLDGTSAETRILRREREIADAKAEEEAEREWWYAERWDGQF